jgi:hypothetical protein
MQLAAVMREVRGHLFADESARQVSDVEATIDGIVIGDGDVIHPAFAQLLVHILWIGIAVRKIEPSE